VHDLLSYIATGPHSGSRAPETSAAAAEKFKAKHGSIRQVVHDAGRNFGASGFTDEDLAFLTKDRSAFERSYRPRRTELANERWFVDTGRRLDVAGNKCVVWMHRDFADNPPPLQAKGRPTPKAPDLSAIRSDAEQKLRIGVWNVLRERGMGQEACYPIIEASVKALREAFPQ
jgi:hypothetical protein